MPLKIDQLSSVSHQTVHDSRVNNVEDDLRSQWKPKFLSKDAFFEARSGNLLSRKENEKFIFDYYVWWYVFALHWPNRTIRYWTTIPLIRKSSACGKLLTLPHTKAVSTRFNAGRVMSINRPPPHRKSRRRPHHRPFKNTNCTRPQKFQTYTLISTFIQIRINYVFGKLRYHQLDPHTC